MSCLGSIKLAVLGVALVLPMAAASVEAAAEEVTVKLWSRADRSGPLRAGNIVAAAEPLNAALRAAGVDKTVKVEVFEGPATGYDQDALDMLKAFSVGQGPDVYVTAHEWVGEFASSGYAMNLVSQWMSVPLERSRPLWQFHLVDGFGPGGALLVRIHHTLA